MAEVKRNTICYNLQNRIKKEICDNYMDALKDKLTPEQLQKFEDVFYSTAKGYLFSRKS